MNYTFSAIRCASLCALCFISCANPNLPPQNESPVKANTQTQAPTSPDYIELFMKRASSLETAFEQYKVTPGGAFIECGEVRNGHPTPSTQDFRSKDAVDLKDSFDKAQQLLTALLKEPPALPKPDKGTSMFDGGEISIKVGNAYSMKEMRTTLNEVANAETPITRLAKILSTTLRKTLKSQDCGKDDFYGIPGSS